MIKNVVLALILTFNSLAYAQQPCEVTDMKKGDVAQCDGVFLTPDASKKVDEAIEDAKYYKALSDKLYQRQELVQKETNILDERLKLYMDQSQILAKELTYKENEDKWQKFMYFGLGVLATGIAVYGASQLSR